MNFPRHCIPFLPQTLRMRFNLVLIQTNPKFVKGTKLRIFCGQQQPSICY